MLKITNSWLPVPEDDEFQYRRPTPDTIDISYVSKTTNLLQTRSFSGTSAEQLAYAYMNSVHSDRSGVKLGNALASALASVGVPTCSKCAQRQLRMNSWTRR